MATYNVRIFGFRGVTQLPLILAKQMSTDSVVQLVQPYEFSLVIPVVIGGAAVSSAPNLAVATVLLRIEVPDGQQIRFEINPPGRGIGAGNQSQSLSGKDQFAFAPGWSVSIADIGAFP